MGKYGFNKNEIRKTIVTMVDKDGFHREINVDSSDEIGFLPTPTVDGAALISVNGKWTQQPGYGYSSDDENVTIDPDLIPTQEIDPEDIQQSVSDWLDNHPEATTTVTDGSITEAKLASAVAQKVNQVTTLSDEIDGVNGAINEIVNKNLLAGLTYISGFINTIGDVTTNSSYYTSDYFPVTEETVYRAGRIRYIAWYSSNSLSGYLSQISIGASRVTDNTFVSPENANYARVTLYADDYNSGNYELHENYNWLTEKTLSGVKEEILQKANLLNDANITFTKNQYHTGGNPVANTSYGWYAYIPVVANVPYVIGPRVRFVELYDATKTFVKNISVSASAQTGPQVVTPDQNGFLIVTVYMEDDNYYVNDGVYPVGVDYILNERYRFGYSTLKYINEYLEELTVDKHSTIKIYNFGDSIAAGDGNNNKGYAELIALEWGCACTDYAVGGSTLSRVTGQSMGAILSQIENASGTAPDIILLEGGANDYTQFRVMGEVTGETIFDSAQFDETEYIGALETAFYKLQTKYPGVPIIWVYTHRENTRNEKTDGTVTVNFTTMHNRSIDVCNKWAIPVVDMYNDGGLNTNWASYRNAYTNNGDGTHPNEAGYKKFYLPLIMAKIEELLQLK